MNRETCFDRDVERRMERNRRHFEREVERLSCGVLGAEEERLCEIEALARFAVDSFCGHYASPELETSLRNVASSFSVSDPIPPRPRSVLMVMSQAYFVGGHTVVVRRWIESDPSRVYSLLLTRQPIGDEIPTWLLDAVAKSGGHVICLDERRPRLWRAKELRRIALGYEKVVLHVHMDDTIPILAFGTEQFPRPVGFYNHADHAFWLGVSIADCVAEIRRYGSDLSRRRRGVGRQMFVGIPPETPRCVEADRAGCRRKLGLQADEKVIVSCGSPYKYIPTRQQDFCRFLRKTLEGDQRLRIIVIGVARDYSRSWEALASDYGDRVQLLGERPHSDVMLYYGAADLAINSFPLGGGTAMSDAVQSGCPMLSLRGPCGGFDWWDKCGTYCDDENALVDRALHLLHDKDEAAALAKRELSECEKENDAEAFLKRINAFLDSLNEPHEVSDFVLSPSGFDAADRWKSEVALRTERNAVRADHFRWHPHVRLILKCIVPYGVVRLFERTGRGRSHAS